MQSAKHSGFDALLNLGINPEKPKSLTNKVDNRLIKSYKKDTNYSTRKGETLSIAHLETLEGGKTVFEVAPVKADYKGRTLYPLQVVGKPRTYIITEKSNKEPEPYSDKFPKVVYPQPRIIRFRSDVDNRRRTTLLADGQRPVDHPRGADGRAGPAFR